MSMNKLKQDFRSLFKGMSIEAKDKPALINDMVSHMLKYNCTRWEAFSDVMSTKKDYYDTLAIGKDTI